MKQFYIKQTLVSTVALLCCLTMNAYDFEVDGIYYNILSATDLTVEITSGDNKYSGELVIPSTVNYKSKVLTVAKVGNSAFRDNDKLTSVTIPNVCKIIEDYAFYNCTALKNFFIEDGKTALSFHRNNTISHIFDNCPLESLHWGRNIVWEGDGPMYSPFYGIVSDNMKKLTIGNKVTTIHAYSFSNFPNLTSVEIPNGVKEICAYAFYGCRALISVTIAAEGVKMYPEVFYGCKELASIYLMICTPPALIDTFSDTQYMNTAIYVPQGTLATYNSSKDWKNFWNIQEHDIPVEVEKCATPTIGYADGKLTFTSETEGAEFVTEITNSDITKHYGSTIELTVAYNVSTYAKRDGYANSDVATVTLCWIEGANGSDIMEIESAPVLIKAYNGTVIINGVMTDTEVAVYSTNGTKLGSVIADGGEVAITTSLGKGNTAIVHIGNKAVKVIMQ